MLVSSFLHPFPNGQGQNVSSHEDSGSTDIWYERIRKGIGRWWELWCWRRLLRVPWTARRSNQSILKEISPECSLEGLMLKLELRYSGHLMQRADSFEKTLMLGKIEGRRRRGQQRMRWLDGITDSMDMSFSKLLVCCGPWGSKESDTIERLN